MPEGEEPPGYESTQFSGNIGGPLSKKASIFFNYEERNINNLNVVNAQIVDPTTFLVTPFSEAVPNPNTRINLSPRLDYQVSASNTLSVRYQFITRPRTMRASAAFNLASLGTNQLDSESTLQVSDTQTLSPANHQRDAIPVYPRSCESIPGHHRSHDHRDRMRLPTAATPPESMTTRRIATNFKTKPT